MKKRTITIFRKRSERYSPEQDALASKRIGSFLTSSGQPFVPLSQEEQKKLMPLVLDMASDEIQFRKAVRDFWSELTIQVPAEGVVLDITTDKDGVPLNIEDYLKYRLAAQHPKVAQPGEPSEGENLRFYIVDPHLERVNDLKKLKSEEKAMEAYLKVTANESKMRNAVAVLDPSVLRPEELAIDDLKLILKQQLADNPDRLLAVLEDKYLVEKALVTKALSLSILTKVGNAIMMGEEKYGDSIEEAAIFLNDKVNSIHLLSVKEHLKAMDAVV